MASAGDGTGLSSPNSAAHNLLLSWVAAAAGAGEAAASAAATGGAATTAVTAGAAGMLLPFLSPAAVAAASIGPVACPAGSSVAELLRRCMALAAVLLTNTYPGDSPAASQWGAGDFTPTAACWRRASKLGGGLLRGVCLTGRLAEPTAEGLAHGCLLLLLLPPTAWCRVGVSRPGLLASAAGAAVPTQDVVGD